MKSEKSQPVHDLEDLFRIQLRNLYTAEQKCEKALDKFADASTSRMLRTALQSHANQTADHIGRLEQVFETIGVKPAQGDAKAFEAVIDSCPGANTADSDADARDAALIGAVQSIEHLEIAGYGCAAAWARRLGHDRAADLLTQTLEQEKHTDSRLTELAESINTKAAHKKPHTTARH